MKKLKKKILAVLVVAIISIQFIPYGRGHSNPSVVTEPEWDSAKTREVFFRACADCHSNETKWPWYSYVAPVSWLVQQDVSEGREHLNISLWGAQKRNHGDDAVEQVEKGEMPLWYYGIIHREAKLSDNDKKEFLSGLAATFGEGKHEHEEDHD